MVRWAARQAKHNDLLSVLSTPALEKYTGNSTEGGMHFDDDSDLFVFDCDLCFDGTGG